MKSLSDQTVKALVILASQDIMGDDGKYDDAFEDGRITLAQELLDEIGVKYGVQKEYEEMVNEESLIQKLLGLGLKVHPFKIKQQTGVNRFIDPRTNEIYITYTTGYVRREVVANGYFSRGDRNQSPINPVIRKKHETYNWMQTSITMLKTEEERLKHLVEYMIRKNAKFAKKGTPSPFASKPYNKFNVGLRK